MIIENNGESCPLQRTKNPALSPWKIFLWGLIHPRDVLTCFSREFFAMISLNMRFTTKLKRTKILVKFPIQ